MAEERTQRRLAAILAADVVGYSRLMEQDEADTFDRLRAHRKELFEPEIAKHGGHIFKMMGDGLLAEFGSVVDAVECAAALQGEMAKRNDGLPDNRRIDVRIGVHVGDVIVEGGDLYGDGVNIAARLQAMAEPGETYVSQTVIDHVKNKVELKFENLGEQTVRNIAEPVRVYRIARTGLVAKTVTHELPLPTKPSIAVLPFENLSGDPEQEYFADGMVEEIITALSRMRWLFVIARNSSFTYKRRSVDVKQVGRELGVRYVLEGSVRKAGNRVRITGQLIDASTGAHLWADRFEGGLEDIFDLQDRVTANVVGTIRPKLEKAEIERAKRKPTESLDAYDYFLRGVACVYRWNREANNEALPLLHRAIERDPDFATAYGMAAWCYVWRKVNGWMTDRAQETAEAIRLAQRAVELGKDDAGALCWGGMVVAYIGGDLDDGGALIEQSLVLDPNFAAAWSLSGWVKVWLCEPEAAIERVARAMRLSPLDPLAYNMQSAIAHAHFVAGRYDDAAAWAERAVRQQPLEYTSAIRILVASSVLANRQADAERAAARLRQVDPTFRICDLGTRTPLRRPEDLARYAEALRKAGLPA
jgi:TolB-like protein/class 3 adenylate cyclase/tetratricopeptide (TPR) repeat protein